MLAANTFIFTSWLWLLAALIASFAAAAIALWRRPAISKRALSLCAIGSLLLSLASGMPIWQRPVRGSVSVMIDLSGSTRTARYHHADHLRQRLDELLGDIPRELIFYSSDNHKATLVSGDLPEMSADRTIFTPPPADAIVLFSDGRFALPATAPPVYAVLDPALERVDDAGIDKLELQGQEIVASVHNLGKMRNLVFEGAAGDTTASVPPGTYVLRRPLATGATRVTVHLTGRDPWPENESASLVVAAPSASERWWVSTAAGSAPPDSSWRRLSPSDLPHDAAAWLAPSVVVLDNISAAELSARMTNIEQYVRDLGGGLVILGGEHAFAAGGYTATALDILSPLASQPPEPAMQWYLLVDSSGSMSDPVAGDRRTRWQVACDALTRLLHVLPPDDPVTPGNFSESIRWWSNGRSVRDTAKLPLPPADLMPSGPTNLQEALKDIADLAQGTLPKQLLLLTDADATIDEPDKLAAALAAKHVHVHLLAIGKGSGLPALRTIIDKTGGRLVESFEAANWLKDVEQLARGAMPLRLNSTPIAMSFHPPLSLPGRTVAMWNRTWLKSTAQALADGTADGQPVPLSAVWQYGASQHTNVAATAFHANVAEASALAALVGEQPRNPQFKVNWETGPVLRVVVDAGDERQPFNDLSLTLELRDAGDGNAPARVLAVPQISPGRYELSADPPRSPAFAFLHVGGRVIDKTSLPGRHAAEFDALGNDHETLAQLCESSGGKLIDTHHKGPVAFNWPLKPMQLSPWLSAAGAAAMAAGLLLWLKG